MTHRLRVLADHLDDQEGMPYLAYCEFCGASKWFSTMGVTEGLGDWWISHVPPMEHGRPRHLNTVGDEE